MTGMAGRRVINLKVLASIKSLGKSAAVTVKRGEKVTLKVPGSVGIFFFFFDVISSLTLRITNEAAARRRRQRPHESPVPRQTRAS